MTTHAAWCVSSLVGADWWHSAGCESEGAVRLYSVQRAIRAHQETGIEVDAETAERIREYGVAMGLLTRIAAREAA